MRRPAADASPDTGDAILFRPIVTTGPSFYLGATALLAVALWGLYAYTRQLRYGLGVTGLNRPVYWGFYITNFVFFVGISHAGTLISAILRLSKAEWRRPITRMAETITVLVLFFGLGSILMDLGRPERFYFVIPFFWYGHLTSPLIWDVLSIGTYLTASTIYLYVPLIPDLALVRDRITGWRKGFYRVLSLGWTGSPKQHRALEIAIGILAVLVIPIAVSVHTVVSWVFAMTIQPMWHSTIFGPYFVVGAIFSGIAALIIAMAIVRRVYHLEAYIKPVHFNYLGTLLLVMTLLWLYFTFAEYLTTYYGHEPKEMAVFWAKVNGPYRTVFWAMVLCDFIVPFVILANRKTRTVTGTVIASISVSIGMWLERFTIIIPTLINPRLDWPRGLYHPSWVEVSITAGFFAAFALLYMVFTKFFPMVSIWEVREGRERGIQDVQERLRGYLPDEVPAGGVSPAGEIHVIR
ncbi:MAG: polysulfide reductase NrfD [Gemmatimonadetes bacterium]|nr:polysulfide reductase NrfD [Gemmatimonadota bacterium]